MESNAVKHSVATGICVRTRTWLRQNHAPQAIAAELNVIHPRFSLMNSYDQGYWHTDWCLENDIDEKYAGTHISVFVKWCAMRGLLDYKVEVAGEKDFEINAREFFDAAERVVNGTYSANEFFEWHLDWKFGPWNIREQEIPFVDDYYPVYLEELNEIQPGVMFGPESAVDWIALTEILDSRYQEYRELGRKKVSWARKRAWWKFW